MSTALSLSALNRALDIASSIVGGRRPKHAAIAASADDVVDLGRAVVALARVAQAAADYLVAQDVALDFSEIPLNAAAIAASEQADAALDAAHTALTEALIGLGYLILENPEMTDGSAS